MSKLSSLCGKPKKYKIGDVELEFYPRTLSELDLILDLTKEDKKANALKELIKRTLKDAVPDASEDELDKVALKYFKELSEAIIDVNGLNEMTN